MSSAGPLLGGPATGASAMSVLPLSSCVPGINLAGRALPALHAEPLPPPAGRPAPGPLPPQPSGEGPLREVHPAPFPFRCVQGGRCINHRLVVYSRCQARVTHLYCWR
jgi:hypothetical protein